MHTTATEGDETHVLESVEVSLHDLKLPLLRRGRVGGVGVSSGHAI